VPVHSESPFLARNKDVLDGETRSRGSNDTPTPSTSFEMLEGAVHAGDSE
jgi:hypothetical protein